MPTPRTLAERRDQIALAAAVCLQIRAQLGGVTFAIEPELEEPGGSQACGAANYNRLRPAMAP